MKKLTTLTILFFAAITAGTAQFQKGQKLLGGSISYSTGTTKTDQVSNFNSKRSNFSFNPSFAWFTSANRLTGFSVGYGRNKTYQEQLSGSSYQESLSGSGSADVFTERYYPVINKLFFTLQGRLGVSYTRGKTRGANGTNNEVENQQRGFGINMGLAPGITYQLSPRVLFDLRLNNMLNAGYSRTTSKNVKPGTNASKWTEESFAVSSSLSSGTLGSVGLGFRWIIK